MKPKGARKSFVLIGFFALVAMVFAFSLEVFAADAGSIVSSLAKEKGQKTYAIENAQALNKFYGALARTAAKQGGALTRIGHYGDSLIEMDLVSGQTRRKLQGKFGDGGHGFALITPSKPWYRPYDLYYKPDFKWMGYDLTMSKKPGAKFGLGNSLAVANKAGAKTVFGTDKKSNIGRKVSKFEILFPLEATGGDVEVKVDGKKKGTLNTSGSGGEGYAEFSVADGPHKLEVKALTEKLRMYGVVFERSGPAVVYDSLGLNSTGVSTFKKLDKAHFSRQIKHRNYDLVILGFGTNEATPDLNLIGYQKSLVKIVKMIKAALPNCSVLIMAPIDKAKKQGSSLVSHPMIPKIVEAQRKAAKESGAAFWSAFDAMGGSGSMATWYKQKLGAGDLMHPTPKGGEKLGNMFYYALMQGFADYLGKNGMPGPAAAAPKSPLKKVEIK